MMSCASPLKVFIVDDDQQMVDFMTLILEAAGHTVSSETEGIMAISKIVAMKPDCLLTDLMMAEMDGFELCEELKSRPELKDIKIIIVSSKDHEHWQSRANDLGAAGYITKPLNKDSFAEQVEAITSSH